jgi:hypothetical protein
VRCILAHSNLYFIVLRKWGRMQRVITQVLLFFVATALGGEPWKLSLDANATVALNTYSSNWAGGEKGAFSWAVIAAATAEKQLGARVNAKNTLKLAFGQTKTQNAEGQSWSAPVKSTDLIDFESVWKTTLGKAVDPFIAVRAITQFLDARSDIDHYGNPLDFTESVGVIRDILKKERLRWNVRLGVAAHQNVDRYPPEGGPAEVVYDWGVELVTELEAALRKDILKYKTRLKAYEAVVRYDAPDGTYWRYPDVNWEHTLSLSVLKYVMVSWYVQLLYDREMAEDDTGGLLWGDRWKNTLAVGLSYSAVRPRKSDKSESADKKSP